MNQKLISIDPGNRAVKVAVPGAPPMRFASILANVRPSQRVALNGGSTLIRYIAGNPDLVGKHWVAGASAKDYSTSGATYLADKALVTPRLAIAAIPVGAPDVELATLYLSHPSPDLVAEQITKALLGEHQYTRLTHGGSVDCRLKINRVEVFPEGYGSIQIGYRSGLLQREHTVGAIDFGGGTVIASLWRDGREIPSARVVLEKQGSFGLAQMVAQDSEMQARLGARAGKPKVDIIMDAIANGSCVYGTTGTQFSDLYAYYLPIWWNGIKEAVLADWSQWMEEIETILLTGGAAPLLANAAANSEGFLKLCEHSQFANCLGMLPTETAAAGKTSKLRIA